MNGDPRTWLEAVIGGTVVSAFVGIFTQQRKQVASTQRQLDRERDSCGERMSLIEARLDQEREDCDRRHRQLSSEVDDLRRTMRSLTPRDFPAVKERAE